MNRKAVYASVAGYMAILLWSGSISFQRVLSEQLGPLATGAGAYMIGGLVGCAILLARPSARRGLRGAAMKETLICGIFFVVFQVCYVTSVGLATGRKQALVVGVINYLWPAITLVLSIPILKSRPRPLLFPVGVIVALAGAVAAAAFQGNLALGDFLGDLRANAWAYSICLVNAVAWSIYSNLTRRWVNKVPGGVVFIYSLAGGILMGAMAVAAASAGLPRAVPHWSPGLLPFLLGQALGPTLGAFFLWETAMRSGNVTLVTVAAYLTPVFSLAASCIVFQQAAGAGLWVGSALVVAGAVLCKLSVREPPGMPSEKRGDCP